MKKYLSENEVLETLNITGFEQIDGSNFRRFLDIFKGLDPAIAKLALSQIRDFQKLVVSTLDEYKHSYDRTVDGITKAYSDYNSLCSRILEILSTMSNNPNNSYEDKELIINTLLEIEARVSESKRESIKDLKEERREHNTNVLTAIGLGAAGLLGVLAIACGLRKSGGKDD